MSETVHRCPEGDAPVTSCCGRTPFELPLSDRLTLDDALVTCGTVPTPDDGLRAAIGGVLDRHIGFLGPPRRGQLIADLEAAVRAHLGDA